MEALPSQNKMELSAPPPPTAVDLRNYTRGGPGVAVPVARPVSLMQSLGFTSHETPPFVPGQNFQIMGKDSQMVFWNLNPGEKVKMQPGAMVNKDQGIINEAKLGSLAGACCGGEELFTTIYTNVSNQKQVLTSSSSFWGAKLFPINLSQFPEGICCKPGIFVCCNDPNMVVGARLAGSFGAALAGGQLFYQTLTGTGTAFIEGGGTILVKNLAPGEVIRTDQNSVLAFSNSVQLTVERAGDCLMMMCGGNGLIVAVATGPGLFIMQSMPKEVVARMVMPAGGGGGGGGGDGGGGGGGG